MLPVTQLDVREGTDAGKGSGRNVVQRSVGEGGRKAGVWWEEPGQEAVKQTQR